VGYAKIVRSGNVIEIYEYERRLAPTNLRAKRNKKDRTGNVFATKKRRSDNLYRLRKSFIRICNANLSGEEVPAFATLTMYQVIPLKRAVVHFSGFIGRLRKRIGRNFRYIAVPEFQKRGAVHFHVLFWGLPDGYVDEILTESEAQFSAQDLKESNSRTLQNVWGYGYVDCFRTNGSPKLASYMSKYMFKTMHDERLMGKKAYVCSRNVLRPVSLQTATSASIALEQWGVDKSLASVREYDTLWLGRCVKRTLIVNQDSNV